MDYDDILKLMDLHGGQSCPIYSVGSCLLAGIEPPIENVQASIDKLDFQAGLGKYQYIYDEILEALAILTEYKLERSEE